MADTDARIQDLTPADSIQAADRFVLEQAGQAKSLTGQILLNDLATALDGHGGISDITYTPPESGSLDGTLTITMADTTTYDVTVTNGNGIESISVVYGIASAPDPSAVSIWYTSVQSPTDAKPYALTRFSMSRSEGDPIVAYTITQKALNPAISIGDVTATEGEDADATVTNSGTAYNPTLNFDFTLPQGEKGDTGDYILPVIAYGTSTAAATQPSVWYNDPSTLSYSSGNFIWKRTRYVLHDDQTEPIAEKIEVIGYIGRNGSGSGTVQQITINGTVYTDDGTGNVSMTIDADDVGAIENPANKSNGQVLTYDSSADAWVAANPTTGNVNTVNNVGVTAGTTNIQLYATAIPMSSSDSTPVSSAIPQAATTTPANLGTAAIGSSAKWARADHVHNMPSASDVGAVSSDNVKFKIYSSVSDIGLTVGSATISGAFGLLPNGSILYANGSDFPTSELPGYYIGIVEIIKEPSGGGIIYFHGQTDAYGEGVMHLTSSNVPSGVWENPAKQNNITNEELVNLSTYTSNLFTFPSDGYVFLSNQSNSSGYLILIGAGQTTGYIRIGGVAGYHTCFVKKGMKCQFGGASNTARFAPLS